MNKNRQDAYGNITPFLTLGIFVSFNILAGAERAAKSEAAVLQFFLAGLGLLGIRFLFASVRKKMIPGCLWLSLICRDTLIVFIIGVAVHLFHGPFPQCVFTLTDIVSLLKSRLPMDHIMVTAYYELIFAGILLNLKRKETRKRALIAFLVWLVLPVLFFVVSVFLQIPDMIRYSVLTAVTSVWPLYCGVSGALFRRLYGKAAQEAYDEKMKAKHARPAAVPGPGTFPSQPSATVLFPPSSPVRTVPNPVPAPARPTSAPARPQPAPEVPPVPRGERLKQKESQLKNSLNKYLAQKEKAEAAVQRIPAGTLLPLAAQRLYPGGEMLSHLDGQRQLFLWLSVLPCLRYLRTSDAAVRLMEDTLPDNPERFLPVLSAVVQKAEQLLSGSMPGDRENWSGLDGETLTGVWFALRMYQRMGSGTVVFDEAAETIEAYMDAQSGLLGWLQQFSGEGESL